MSADPQHFDDPRRFELIEWFLEHHPRSSVCTTPFIQVNPEAAPEAYRKLKTRWLSLVTDAPSDPQLARGAAAFIAVESVDEAKRLLETAIEHKPNHGWLWIDLGRMSRDPRQRLAAFEKAREAGETLPNLLVWVGMTSFEAGDYEKAERGTTRVCTRGSRPSKSTDFRIAKSPGKTDEWGIGIVLRDMLSVSPCNGEQCTSEDEDLRNDRRAH